MPSVPRSGLGECEADGCGEPHAQEHAVAERESTVLSGSRRGGWRAGFVLGHRRRIRPCETGRIVALLWLVAAGVAGHEQFPAGQQDVGLSQLQPVGLGAAGVEVEELAEALRGAEVGFGEAGEGVALADGDLGDLGLLRCRHIWWE